MSRIHKQKGVALLVVLILLVMMSALAAKISQQFCRNLQKTHYQVSQQQLRWAMLAQEKVVKDRLQTDASGESKPLSLDGDWHQPLETRGEDYTVVSQVEDAQDCFNVNNLLTADAAPQGQSAPAVPEKPRKAQIIEQLLTESGLSQSTAEEVYFQLVDYLDGDSTTAKEGGRERCVGWRRARAAASKPDDAQHRGDQTAARVPGGGLSEGEQAVVRPAGRRQQG